MEVLSSVEKGLRRATRSDFKGQRQEIPKGNAKATARYLKANKS